MMKSNKGATIREHWLVIAVLLACIMIAAGCTSPNASPESASSGSASDSKTSSSPPAVQTLSVSSPKPSQSATKVLPESEWGDLFATIGDNAIAFGQRVQGDLPVKAYACWQGIGGGYPIWFEDPADIVSLFNALASSGVAGEATTMTTDDYYSFGFEFANGETFGFMFDSMVVQVKDGDSWKFYDVAASPALAAFANQAMKHTMGDYR